MQVFLARAYNKDEGSIVYGVYSNMDAAIARLNEAELSYSEMCYGKTENNIVYNRTDGYDSLQVVVYTLEG